MELIRYSILYPNLKRSFLHTTQRNRRALATMLMATSFVGKKWSLLVEKRGWAAKRALFKCERYVLSIGLGTGKALDTFNESIVEYEEVKREEVQ